MTNMAEASSTDGFQVSNSVKKKKKKKKERRLGREKPGQKLGTGFCSRVSSEPSSIFSWRFDDQATEDSETPQKKSKKKAWQERSDSQLDHSCITTENELTSESGMGVCKPKKKKKRKLSPSEQDDGDQPCVPLSQGVTSSQPNVDSLRNGDCTDGSTPVKKKRAKVIVTHQDEGSRVCARPTINRTDSTCSDKHEEANHSCAEDSQVELFTSSPCKMQCSSLSQEQVATKWAASAELGSFLVPRKPQKHKKSSGVEDSDTTGVTPRKSQKHKESSGVGDSDTTSVTPRKTHKLKKSSGVEDSDTTGVTPRKPHKLKKSSGVEDSDTTGVTPRKPHKLKKSSGVEDSDTTGVTPRKPQKHKESSGVEDSDTTGVTPRKPQKHKKSSGVEDSDTTGVTPRKSQKHKKSSGVEDSDTAGVTPRKTQKHKESSGVEDSDTAGVTPRKTQKHKESSGVENSGTTDVTPRKPHKLKKSFGVEDSDTTGVTPRKPNKLKKSSGVEDSDTGFCSLVSTEPSSIFSWRVDNQATEDSQTPQKKSKKKAWQERSDSQLDHSCITTESELTNESGMGVCKPKKKKRQLSPIEQDDGDQPCVPLSQGVTSSQPNVDSLRNGDCTDGSTPVKKKRAKVIVTHQDEGSRVCARPTINRTDSTCSDKHEEANHSCAEDSQVELFTSSPCKMQCSSLSQEQVATKWAASAELGSFLVPRKPQKHKKSSGVADSDTTGVTPRKSQKHKKSSGVGDSDTTGVTARKPHKHKKSSGVEDSDTTCVTPRKPNKLKKSSGVEDSDTGFCSLVSTEPSSIFSWRIDNQATEDSQTPQKKSKKKAWQERSDSQLDHSCITTESELTNESGMGVCKPKKKKKRKFSPSEQDDGDQPCVPLSQGVTSSQPNVDSLRNGDCTDGSTPVKKKRAKVIVTHQDEGSRVCARPTINRTDSTCSDKHEEANHSCAEDSQVELFTSSPCKMQCSSLSQEQVATKWAASAELGSFLVPRKPQKHKKSSGVEDSDTTGVTPRKSQKHKESSGVGDSDTTDVTPRKPHKHKKSFSVENSDSTDVTARKPHKHKKSSGVEDSDTPSVTPRKPHKHKKPSDVKDSDSTGVTPRKTQKHKKSFGVEDSDTTDVTPRKPHKLKKSFGVEDSDTTDVTTRKSHKLKKSSGVEDFDTTDVIPRKPHKHKKPSDVKDSDTTGVTPRKPQKHKESSGVENSDTTGVTPRKPQKLKKSSGVGDSDTTGVTPRKSQKHKESSDVENSDTTGVTPRKPQKHKKSSGVEDSDTTGVTPRKPHKHKNVKDSDTTDVTPRKPHKHKKSSGVEDSDTTDVTTRKSHKLKKSSGVEDFYTTDVTPRKPHKHKKSSGVEDSDTPNVIPKKPHKHKNSFGVKDSDSTSVTPRKPHKHKKPSDVKDSDSTGATPRKPHMHKKSSGVEDSDSSDIGFTDETVRSFTDHDQIKNQSQAKCFPLEDSDELSKISEDVVKLSSTEHPAIEDNEFLHSSKLVLPDLDVVTQELEEFIPHVRNLSASAIKQLARQDLVRFKNFKERGIAVKFGKFTKKENDQLRKNVEAFLQESGIKSAEKLLFTHRFPEEMTAIKRLKVQHSFGIRIAEGIPRPWRLVYYRARKIFDPNNYSGRYSAKDKKMLLKYQAMYGNDWKKISQLMSRSSGSVALKYSQIKSEPKSGPWSKEETRRLIQAVEEILKENCKEFSSALGEEDKDKALSVVRKNLYKGISWRKVEGKVGTRHWRQCKQKWISIVTKRMFGGQVMSKKTRNLQFKINLIERLYKLNVEDAHEIDWEVLSTIIGDVPPDYIQKILYRLKASHVPSWKKKTFPEIISHLYEKTLPQLTALLKSKKSYSATNVPSAQVKEQRKVFQLQDIFQESSDELIDESEEELKAESGKDISESFCPEERRGKANVNRENSK